MNQIDSKNESLSSEHCIKKKAMLVAFGMNYEQQAKIILLEELTKARTKNPRHSMRAFAARLGVAQSVISQVLNSKRPLTKKTARRILAGLGKSPTEISQIIEESHAGDSTYTPLDVDAFHLVADWYNYAILSLANTKGFRGNPAWVAKRLGINTPVAKSALDRLLRLNLLKKTGTTVVATGNSYEAISPSANLALRKANQENLILAEKALAEVSVELRDFTAITLCFDPARIEEARRMIKAFRRNFDRLMEAGHKREVYKLCVQLFPLSKAEEKL